MIGVPGSIQSMLKDLIDNGCFILPFNGVPTSGTSGTGANLIGIGGMVINTASGIAYRNIGTKASPTWSQIYSGGGSTGFIPSASLEASVLRQTEVAITNAQVLAIRATPISLVAAPGAGFVNEFLSAVLLFDRTAVYSESTDNLAVKYVDGSGTQISVTIETTGFLDAAADAVYFAKPIAGTILGVKTLFENQALVLHNVGDGEFGGGDAANVLRVKTTYRTWATGF